MSNHPPEGGVKHTTKMEKIKLEVGKTYRNRKGEEVKIVRKDNKGWGYWDSSNGEWYHESGKWSCYSEEHPKDFIEEVTATHHTFAIPEGVKQITLDYFGNRIVVEMVPEKEPKPGDVPESTRIWRWVEEHLNDGYYNQQGIAEVIGHYLKYREGEK